MHFDSVKMKTKERKKSSKELRRIKANLSQLKAEQAKIKALREKKDAYALTQDNKKCFSHITEKIKLSKKLRYAARSGKFEFLEKIIQKIAVDQINAKSNKGCTGER